MRRRGEHLHARTFKEGTSQVELADDTADRPHVDWGAVVEVEA